MKIKELRLGCDDEVIVKVTKETLALFKLEIAAKKDAEQSCGCLLLAVSTETAAAAHPAEERTAVLLRMADGRERRFEKARTGRADEKPAAAARRLYKLNLYDALTEAFGAAAAPWGVLHGVRPTKIVHQYIRRGMERADIVRRLREDYAVRADKAELLTDVAYRQRPFLRQTDARTVSVYIGIPFCLSRCLYCSFPSYVLPGAEQLSVFMAALEKDMAAARQAVARCGLKVQSVYVGGGTPTSLPDAEFYAFLQAVKASFIQPGTVEFTVEAGRPDSVTEAKIDAMCALGVDRVSVNPQTMQEKTLKHIGRNHTVRDIIDLFGKFRARGKQRINMDLIIGLPGETVLDAADTIRKVTALAPDDITLHALALKRGAALKMRREDYALPSDEAAGEMFSVMLRQVEQAGYTPYYLYRQGYMSGNLENIGCCRRGSEGIYNIQIMEEHQTVIGIGPAATTKVVAAADEPLQTSFNAKDLSTYLRDIDKYIEKRARLLDAAFGK